MAAATDVPPLSSRLIRILLCLVAVGSGLAESASNPGSLAVVGVGTALQLAASLLVGSRVPPLVPVVAVCAVVVALAASPGVWSGALAAGQVFWTGPAICLSIACLFLRTDTRRDWAIAAAPTAVYLVTMTVNGGGPVAGLAASAPVLAGCALAALLHLQQTRRDRVEERQRRRAAEAARRLADERAELATDMHDHVTHRLTHLVLVARMLASETDDATAQARARTIEDTATETLTALRDTLRGFTRPAVEEAPAESDRVAATESLEEIRALVRTSQDVGERATLLIDPTPTTVAAQHPGAAPVWRTLVRVVQEGLANARKHAPGAEVTVEIRLGDRYGARVRTGAPVGSPDQALAETGSGTGLRGLGRRVELLGGTIVTGGTPDGGHLLDAEFPVVPATAEEGG